MTAPREPSVSLGDRVLLTGLHALGALLVAGAVHIAAVLAIPRSAPRDAYARVGALAGGQVLRPVAAPAVGDPALPYRDPAVAAAFCLYDLRGAAARVEVDVRGAASASVSLHDRHGRTFYGLTNRSASNGRIALVVMTARQFAAAAARDTGEEPDTDLRVVATEPEGFAEIQVLAPEPDELTDARAQAAHLLCSAVAPQP